MLIAVDRAQCQVLKSLLLRLSHARYVIRGVTIWCRAMPCSAVAVRAAGVCRLAVVIGNHAPIAAALATDGDNGGCIAGGIEIIA